MDNANSRFEETVKKISQLELKTLRIEFPAFYGSNQLKLKYYNENLTIEEVVFYEDELTKLELPNCDIKLAIYLPMDIYAYQIYTKLLQLNIADIRYMYHLTECDNFHLYDSLYVNFNCLNIEISADTENMEEYLNILPNLLIRIHNGNIKRSVILKDIKANYLMATRLALVELGFTKLFDEDNFLRRTNDIDCEFDLEITQNYIDFVWCWKDPHYDYARFNYDYDDLTL